jgi:hypothetical protein
MTPLRGTNDLWIEDCRCSLEWYIRSIYISRLKEAISFTSYKDHVTWEVRINDNVELTAERSNLNSANFTLVSISSYVCTESASEFKNVSNFRRNDYEIRSTTKCLTVNLSRNVIDSFNESLIPFAYCSSEIRSSRVSANLKTS